MGGWWWWWCVVVVVVVVWVCGCVGGRGWGAGARGGEGGGNACACDVLLHATELCLTADPAAASCNPASRLPRPQAWSTLPAELAGLGGRKGSLAAGYDADIVAWSPEALADTSPEALQVGGRVRVGRGGDGGG